MHDPNPDDYIETDLDDKSDITEDESVYQHSTDGIYAVVPDVNNDTIIYDVVTNWIFRVFFTQLYYIVLYWNSLANKQILL